MNADEHNEVKELLNGVYECLRQIEGKLADTSSNQLGDIEIKLRRSRDKLFPDGYFSDAAWDILLALDRAERLGHNYVMTDAGVDAKIPMTTTLRYLAKLERDGYIERYPDQNDRRRSFVKLTPFGQSAMDEIFERVNSETQITLVA